MSQQHTRLGRRVLGPFDILDNVGRDTVPICNFPFSQVEGGHVSVSLTGNLAASSSGGTFAESMFEIEIVGVVQGAVDVLKRGWINENTGPLRKSFERWEVYEQIEIRARNMTGGKPGGNIDPTVPVFNSTANQFRVQATVNLQAVRKPEPPRKEPI